VSAAATDSRLVRLATQAAEVPKQIRVEPEGLELDALTALARYNQALVRCSLQVSVFEVSSAAYANHGARGQQEFEALIEEIHVHQPGSRISLV